jgi:hypothetical protein
VTDKQRCIRIIEKFLNKVKKEEIELFYGVGTRIKVKQIDYITQGKYIMIDVTIHLGDVINEDVLDRGLIDYLIQDIIQLLFPDYSSKVLLGWDV